MISEPMDYNGQRALANEDYWRLRIISEARLSPDGTRVAYTVNWLDEETDSARSAIWLVNLTSGMSEQLTQGQSRSGGSVPVLGSGSGSGTGLHGGESQPRWSPDGSRLAFVATSADGPPQIYLQDLATNGQVRRLTDSPGGAFFPAWSPDGKAIAYVSSEPTDDHLVPIETEWLKQHPNLEDSSPRLRHVTKLKSRLEGRGFVESHTHVFVVDVEGNPERQLTHGDFDDGAPAWSPNGKEIVFSSNRSPDAEQRLLTTLWRLNLDTGSLHRLDGRDMQEIHSPVFSPDGNMIAFYGASDLAERRYFQGMHLWVVSREGHDERNLAAELDRQSGQTYHEHLTLFYPDAPSWSPDGSILYFHASDHGDEAIFTVSPEGGPARRLSAEHAQVFAPQVTPDGKNIVCLASTPTRPFEVCTLPSSGGILTWLTSTNGWLKTDIDLAEPEHIQFSGAQGLDIEGWLIKPHIGARIEPYPLILHVHGGPYLGWANTFYFQFQALAAAGYASLYINPRGSAGYGQDFTRLRDYGENDYQDLMLGLDVVLAHGEVDPGRLGVTGLSFGGFMTNWIVSQTDRFAAALTVNGISNWMTKLGASDIMAMWQGVEWGGAFWDSDELWDLYRRRSPVTFIRDVTTPLMLFGSENDFRVPIEQEELMLTALRAEDRVVEMIRFPGASHLIATSAAPHHRVAQWQLAQDWFDRWLGGSASGRESANLSEARPHQGDVLGDHVEYSEPHTKTERA